MPRKLYLETFGCQMNVLDSELVLGQLRAQGFEPIDDREQADVILYNTCSVREHAEQKVWSRLGELRLRKKEQPGLIIGVIGCMAERDGANLFQRFPHVDILCGPGELDKLPAMVRNAVLATMGDQAGEAKDEGRRTKDEPDGAPGSSLRSEPGVDGAGITNNYQPPTANSSSHASRRAPARQVALMGSTSRRSSTRDAAQDTLELLDLSRAVSPGDDLAQAYVRITRGCNKFCSYCVVPFTRGPEVDRPPQNIIDEVKKLADAGAIEVTLLGQTINHYHFVHGDGRKTTFADLLYAVHEAVPALPRLRFVTSFPRDFTDQALQAMRDCSRICRYLHVPSQSGSDRILKLMNRGYTAGQYYDFIDRARAYMPDLCIASDFIVGFPTETDEDFAQSVEMVRRCRFKNSFIFKYSPRPGTLAIDRYADDVPDDVKRRRNNELLAVQGEISAQNNRAMIGQVVEVMVEGATKLVSKRESVVAQAPADATVPLRIRSRNEHPNSAPHATTTAPDAEPLLQMIGRTRGDQVVAFDGPESVKGRLVQVEITDSKSLTLFARVAPAKDIAPLPVG